MKKIILLLLLSIATYGQIVPTGQEQDFDYGIKNTASQLDDNAAYLTVQDANGVQGKSASSVWAKKIYVDNADVKKSFLSTGLIKNGLVTNNGDPSKFNITAGIGIITNFDNPEIPTSTIVSFPAFTGITPAYLTTGNITYVAINISSAVVMQATAFTAEQRRDLIVLGAVIHSNLTTINLVNNISAPTNSGVNQLHDLYEFIGALNLTGNKYTANGANLSLDKTAGIIGKLGVNFANNWKDPNRLTIGQQTLLTFRYRTQNGTESTDLTVLNPAVYDLNNVLTAVPSNKFSIQTVTLFQTGATRIQYGQSTYATLPEAEAAILTRAYVIEPNIAANGIARAYIILKNTATSLLNANDTKIIEAQKFGGTASGGTAVTDAAVIAALGFTPENVANKSNSYTVSSSTTYASTKAVVDGLATKQNTLTNPITGTGTTNYISKFTASGMVGNSSIIDNGSLVSVMSPQIITDILSANNAALSGSALSVNQTWNTTGNPTTFKINVDDVTSGSSSLLVDFKIKGISSFIIDKNSNLSLINRNPGGLFPSSSGTIRFQGQNNSSVYWSGIESYRTNYGDFLDLRFFTCLATPIERMRITPNGAILINTPTENGIDKLLVNGSTKTTALTLATAPTTSAGTYGILTRNSSTGVVEKVLSNTLPNIGNTNLSLNSDRLLNGVLNLGIGTYGLNIENLKHFKTSSFQSGGKRGEFSFFPVGEPTKLFEIFANQNDNLEGSPFLDGLTTMTRLGYYEFSGNSSSVDVHGNYINYVSNNHYFQDYANNPLFSIAYGGFSSHKNASIFAYFDNANLTLSRDYALPDASGTIALVETVKPYKVYTALLSQTGTSAPTATVLENTLGGTVVWTRTGVGSYVATLTGAFVLNKTSFLPGSSSVSGFMAGARGSNDTFLLAVGSPTALDGLMTNATIEIRVYN